MPISTPSGIFKAYDIRGLLDEEIDGDLAERIGRAFARVLADLRGKPAGALRVGLGRDMRIGAAELSDRYRDGMMAEGAHVLDAGLVGTEMLYFLVGSHGLDGGLMCTASHNPRAYTGAKLVREGGRALSGDTGIGEVAALVAEGLPDEAPGGGSVETVDVAPAYHARLRTFVDPAALRPLRIVLDGGSGMAAHTIGPVLEDLPGLDLVRTFWEPDGTFPDHEPNPLLEENRRAIVERVLAEGADLGMAFDGDADRCFLIDESGRFVDGDFLCALLARQVLTMRPGADVLYDVRASWAVPDTVRDAGGRAHVNRVGHAYFKARMHGSTPPSAARSRGTTTSPTSSTRTPARCRRCSSSSCWGGPGLPLGQLLEPYRSRYFISGEVNSEVADPHGKLAEIRARYADADQTELDGVSVDYADWHFNVRCSNTEPLVRLCLESLVSPAHMEARRDEVLAVLRS